MMLMMQTTSRKGVGNKIPIHYGMIDYYNYFKWKYRQFKLKYKIDETLYLQIVSEFNKELANTLVDDVKDIELPYRLGTIGVRKYKPELKLNDSGGLVNKLPVNPIETAKLWEENEEAKNKKLYIRYVNKHSDGYVFYINYFKSKARYKNQKAYDIQCMRELKRRIANNIKEKKIDAYL